jgi:hypothetical protein
MVNSCTGTGACPQAQARPREKRQLYVRKPPLFIFLRLKFRLPLFY